MEQDMVTILMATYNGEQYILEQLESLRKQDYRNWKLIIGDDNSKDRTLEIISKFQQDCPNQIEVIRNNPPTGSAMKNFMSLLKKADTPYIMFCDQDDVWEPHKIRVTLECMKQLEKKQDIPILVHSDLAVFSEKGVISESFFAYQNLPTKSSLHSLIIQNSVTGCTMMINRCLQERMMEVDDYKNVIMHDYWAALIAAVYGKIGFVENHTMYYRQHNHNSVGAKASKSPLYLIGRLREGRRSYKEQMKKSMMQIGYFLQCYEKTYPIESEKRLVLEKYASLFRKNKCYRWWFYTRYQIRKKGMIRVCMQYIWG